MMDFSKKMLCMLLISVVMVLTSCSEMSICSYSDELVSSLWYTKLENETQIMLSFTEDEATLEVTQKGEEKHSISGFCEVSDSIFVIYDNKTKTPYAFEYIVHFDRVNVKYLTNTVSLYKT